MAADHDYVVFVINLSFHSPNRRFGILPPPPVAFMSVPPTTDNGIQQEKEGIAADGVRGSAKNYGRGSLPPLHSWHMQGGAGRKKGKGEEANSDQPGVLDIEGEGEECF